MVAEPEMADVNRAGTGNTCQLMLCLFMHVEAKMFGNICFFDI
jgi:hypothetical protein